MERSSLTDELEQPVSDSLYESSDNSQSIQRRRNCRCCFEGQNHASHVQELVPTSLREACNSPQRTRINMDKKSEMALTESLYKELVVNWIPTPLQKHLDVGDQEWLFQTKQPRSDTRDTSTANYGVLHQGNFTQYPHAQYLPEVNICALPYTIPY
ncbi:hypothetical protein CCACVL1_16655 [Corchorus capsularis]|uniref:Uncharacterized protein n=1 Tax=Corchorus capsularis TaxID=210143 RepID=A0A1R3HW66_COCAP|nr:hypothetical protein CCACVL1_16655 [Corchorus capsularis]